jgi:four helix bundle protein
MPRRQFDHEKLEVYQYELRFIEWANDLLIEVGEQPKARLREVCDQLDRSSLSSLHNTAEGNGRRALKQRARFFDDARGSATESAACLDALVAKRACSKQRVDEGKELLSIVSMLTKLVEKFGGSMPEEEGGGRAGAGLVGSRAVIAG